MNEVLVILQEECAEVIQIASKVHRFGLDNDNKKRLEQELGDLQCMIDLCVEHKLVDPIMVEVHKQEKREKLKVWSDIERL